MKALREEKLDKKTLVFFTSDNGPWLQFGEHGGSAGLLRDGKGSTWEGGMRVPGIAWWPGTVPAGVTTQEMASTMDLFVTAVKLAGGEVPADRPIDGYDLDAAAHRQGDSRRATRCSSTAARSCSRSGTGRGRRTSSRSRPTASKDGPTTHDPPLLYHLGRDPGEKTDVAKDNPEVVSQLKAIAAKHSAAMKPGEPQLEARVPAMQK